MSAPPGPWVDQWLSVPRFDVYVTEARGDRVRALALYEWNATMAAAVFRDLGHLEVAIRNAYNDALVAKQGSRAHWTSDALRYFPPRMRRARNGARIDNNSSPRDQIKRAMADAGGPAAPPGKVVAELMFGFWRYMTSAANEHTLWTPYLRLAFVKGTKRVAIDEPMTRLHQLRNRVAHHEHLMATDLTALRQDLIEVLGLIEPQIRDHVANQSTWSTVQGQRP